MKIEDKSRFSLLLRRSLFIASPIVFWSSSVLKEGKPPKTSLTRRLTKSHDRTVREFLFPMPRPEFSDSKTQETLSSF